MTYVANSAELNVALSEAQSTLDEIYLMNSNKFVIDGKNLHGTIKADPGVNPVVGTFLKTDNSVQAERGAVDSDLAIDGVKMSKSVFWGGSLLTANLVYGGTLYFRGEGTFRSNRCSVTRNKARTINLDCRRFGKPQDPITTRIDDFKAFEVGEDPIFLWGVDGEINNPDIQWVVPEKFGVTGTTQHGDGMDCTYIKRLVVNGGKIMYCSNSGIIVKGPSGYDNGVRPNLAGNITVVGTEFDYIGTRNIPGLEAAALGGSALSFNQLTGPAYLDSVKFGSHMSVAVSTYRVYYSEAEIDPNYDPASFVVYAKNCIGMTTRTAAPVKRYAQFSGPEVQEWIVEPEPSDPIIEELKAKIAQLETELAASEADNQDLKAEIDVLLSRLSQAALRLGEIARLAVWS